MSKIINRTGIIPLLPQPPTRRLSEDEGAACLCCRRGANVLPLKTCLKHGFDVQQQVAGVCRSHCCSWFVVWLPLEKKIEQG